MNDKIEIGMYVRTDEGFIGKLMSIETKANCVHSITKRPVTRYEFDSQMWDSRLMDGYYDHTELYDYELENLSIEPSYKIIDLIRPGDLITLKNPYHMGDVYKVIIKADDVIEAYCHCDGLIYVYNNDIKSVLTKEQFEMMMYKVRKDEK